MSKVPFWWVVRGERGYYDTDLGWFPRQRHATPFLSREAALCAELRLPLSSGKAARVVRVHARIPEPKLPAWVNPVILGNERHLVGVRRVCPGEVVEYVFHVADNGALAAVDLWQHTPNGKRFRGGFTAAPPDVWAEAAARAAKMLRARRAGK